MIRTGEVVAEVAGEAAVQEGIVHALAIGLKVGACGGVVEFAEETADLRAAAGGRKTAAFGKKIEFRNSRGALVAEDLYYAGHGVGTVKGAFGAMNDLDFVDVIEGEI